MQAAGIEPNLIVYTTLIQTCINSEDLETAWHIFDLIKYKSTATAPDVSTYSLMIHACAQKGEVERALDLFTDMTQRRELTPTAETYHALIHACAMRKEYFAQAWQYAVEIQREGLKINLMTLNVLVQACGRSGNLTRARLLVRHMFASNPEIHPDTLTYQNLLRAYANYQPPKLNSKLSKTSKLKQVLTSEEACFIQPDYKLTASIDQPESIPFLKKPILQNSREVLDEAALIVNWLRDMKPEMIDTQLLNSYLDICVCQKSFTDLTWSYRNDFENPKSLFAKPPPNTPSETEPSELSDPPEPSSTQPTSSPPEIDPKTTLYDLPKLPRNLYTFRIALQGAVENRNLSFAREVWSDRMAYVRSPAYWSEPPAVRTRSDFIAETLLIDVLALANRLGEAARRVEVLSADAKFQWTTNDLKTLRTKAVQLEDPSTVELVDRVTKWEKRGRYNKQILEDH
jgi:pentatricopeptide repeat protein